MSGNVRKALPVAIAAIVAASVVFADGLSSGSRAPDFTMKDTAGRTFKLSDYKGKVVFINFFATWCPPCRAEFPEIVRLHAKYRTHPKVKIVSLSLDAESSLSKVKPFADGYKAKHSVLLGSASQKVAENYKVESIPQNFLIRKDGKVGQTWLGYRGPDDMKSWDDAIKKAMK